MFGAPKIQPLPPPPQAPSRADASIFDAGQASQAGYSPLISTSSRGLLTKSNTAKPSLIGGGSR